MFTCRIIAVRNLVGGPPSVIESAIRNLELGLQETAVNAVLRHDVGDSTTATTQINVHFVPPGSVNRTAKKLADDGYPNGPPAGPEMMLREGQRLTVRFRGNICAADGSTVSIIIAEADGHERIIIIIIIIEFKF